MFTGIIKELGVVKRFDRMGPAYRIEIEAAGTAKDAAIGGSVSVNGVCLTVVEKGERSMGFDVMDETVKRSTLSSVKKGDKVNLESSLKAGEELGGHFVLGHVDCVGRIVSFKRSSGESSVEVEFLEGYSKLLVEKGSVSIDGISLTVGDVSRGRFKVYVIPHTLKVTTLGLKKTGDSVNLEFDIVGKYMARFDDLKKGSITEEYLREKGF